MAIVNKKQKPVVDVSTNKPEIATEVAGAPKPKIRVASKTDKLVEEGGKIRSHLTAEQKANEGIYSEHVKRVVALTANKFIERTVINKVQTFEPAIVGYKFMADIPLEGIAKANGKVLSIPANTEFILTRHEAGEFFSRPEMGGMSSDSRLTVRYNKTKAEFTPLLNDLNKQAVKSNSITIDTVDEVDGVKKYTLLDEYKEDFAFLYVRRSGSRQLGTGGRKAKDAERQKNLAAGLYAFFQAKKKAEK